MVESENTLIQIKLRFLHLPRALRFHCLLSGIEGHFQLVPFGVLQFASDIRQRIRDPALLLHSLYVLRHRTQFAPRCSVHIFQTVPSQTTMTGCFVPVFMVAAATSFLRHEFTRRRV